MPQEVYQHTFANGLTLLAERMEHVRSRGAHFLVPAGCAYDPPDQPRPGRRPVRADHPRGRRARQPGTDARPRQPRPGPQRERRRHAHALLGRHHRPQPARRPGNLRRHPPPAAPARRRTRRRSRRWPCRTSRPGGRARARGHGRAAQAHLPDAAEPTTTAAPLEGIEALTPESSASTTGSTFRPRGTILSVAGNIEWEPLRDQVGRLFGDWQGARPSR